MDEKILNFNSSKFKLLNRLLKKKKEENKERKRFQKEPVFGYPFHLFESNQTLNLQCGSGHEFKSILLKEILHEGRCLVLRNRLEQAISLKCVEVNRVKYVFIEHCLNEKVNLKILNFSSFPLRVKVRKENKRKNNY